MESGAGLSVIIPALNEEAAIGRAIDSARGDGVVEVIVVDGGSRDSTAEVARGRGAVVLAAGPGRARQMNAGAAVARGEVLVFLHADTVLPPGFAAAVAATLARPGTAAGAFRLRIDGGRWAYRLLERLVHLRSTAGGLPYGDQALFLPAATFRRLGGYADWPILEDVDLVRRLRRAGRVRIAPAAVRTSARRWERHGLARTTGLNLACLAAHALGVPPGRIARWRRSFTA